MELVSAFVQLDPALQEVIALAVTAVVSFLFLQLANLYPALAQYLGQYKVGIITWLTGVVVQVVQSYLNNVPANWEQVAVLVMQLIAEVVIVLGIFAAYRRAQIKGSQALMPS